MSALSLSGAGAASAEFSGRRGIAPGSDRGSRGGGTGGAAAVAGAAGGTHSSSFGQFGAMASCVHIRLPPSSASALAGHRHMHVLIAGITQAAAQNNLRCQPILTAASGVGHREQCLGSARNGGAGCRPAAAFQRQTIRRDAFPPERQGGGAWLPGAPVAVCHRCCIISATIGRPATHHHLPFSPHCTRSAQSSPSEQDPCARMATHHPERCVQGSPPPEARSRSAAASFDHAAISPGPALPDFSSWQGGQRRPRTTDVSGAAGRVRTSGVAVG